MSANEPNGRRPEERDAQTRFIDRVLERDALGDNELHTLFVDTERWQAALAAAEPGSREARYLTEELAAAAMRGMRLMREAMDEEERRPSERKPAA
jgi:hypothetical protein